MLNLLLFQLIIEYKIKNIFFIGVFRIHIIVQDFYEYYFYIHHLKIKLIDYIV